MGKLRSLAPLVIVAWFLWPLVPFEHSPGDLVRALATAYTLFFLSRGLAFLASSSSRVAVHLAFVFLFSWILSFSVWIALIAAGLDESSLGSAAIGAFLDALWCTVAAALYAGGRKGGGGGHPLPGQGTGYWK